MRLTTQGNIVMTVSAMASLIGALLYASVDCWWTDCALNNSVYCTMSMLRLWQGCSLWVLASITIQRLVGFLHLLFMWPHKPTSSQQHIAPECSVFMNAPIVRLLSLHRYPIYKQLIIEEALLRNHTANWCILNNGCAHPSIVLGVSG